MGRAGVGGGGRPMESSVWGIFRSLLKVTALPAIRQKRKQVKTVERETDHLKLTLGRTRKSCFGAIHPKQKVFPSSPAPFGRIRTELRLATT